MTEVTAHAVHVAQAQYLSRINHVFFTIVVGIVSRRVIVRVLSNGWFQGPVEGTNSSRGCAKARRPGDLVS